MEERAPYNRTPPQPIQNGPEAIARDAAPELALVCVDGQQYQADAGTREGLDAYFCRKTDRLKPYLTRADFNRYVQDRIAQGRMRLKNR